MPILINCNDVHDESMLNAAIVTIDDESKSTTDTAYTINLRAGLTGDNAFLLTSAWEAINLGEGNSSATGNTLTIVGSDDDINGNGDQRGFFVYSGEVKIQDLTVEDAKALGGAGGIGGGGGAGLGGGLFVAGATTAVRAQDPETGSKTLLGMLSAGEHGADQSFGVGPNFTSPAAEPIRRPIGKKPVCARHVIGVRAVLAAHVAPLMNRDALPAMEHLDDALGDAHLDLGANEGVRNRVQEVVDLYVVIEIDPRAPPFRELPILGRQAVECGALDLLEQLAPAEAEMAHGAVVHALHDQRDGMVAFGE